jgi:S1/P1 Nuclease
MITSGNNSLLYTANRLALILLYGALCYPNSANAWGKKGHRIVGEIAQKHLNSRSQAQLEKILGSESLADGANWPDFMRSDSNLLWSKTYLYWHYVTIPEQTPVRLRPIPPEGDALTALNCLSAVIVDAQSTNFQKKAAVRFITHIIGDVHQPLHAGNGKDRGGTDVEVNFFSQPTNLHVVWDSLLIDNTEMSSSEMVSYLLKGISSYDRITWGKARPEVWIEESVAFRSGIYPKTKNISFDYIYSNSHIIEKRLKQAGVRLASFFNNLFGNDRRLDSRSGDEKMIDIQCIPFPEKPDSTSER